jgi:oxygen-independent coproporphyrinogen III oxidase
MESMVDAIIREMDLAAGFLKGADAPAQAIGTVYLGGGTPSLLPDPSLRRLLGALGKRYRLAEDAEVTLEANPDDIDADRLEAWKAAGINRLSIGVQSFREEDLLWMNRAHSASQAREAIRSARAAGFDHDSIDLIYGTPGLTDEALLENLREAIDLGCPHLSCYALTVEPRTALSRDIRAGKIPPTDPETQARQFLLLIKTLTGAGYEHYEISNFALPGQRSRHNSSYWHGVPYLGLGPSAHSFDGRIRRWNVAGNAAYMAAIKKGELPYEAEVLTPVQQLNEYTMTALRTSEGLDLEKIESTWGKPARRRLEKAAGGFIAAGKMQRVTDKLILTTEGKLFADGIASVLFFDEGELEPGAGLVTMVHPTLPQPTAHLDQGGNADQHQDTNAAETGK